MDFKEELEILLNNFIVTKEKDKTNYYKIKSKIKKIREFTTNKLGCDVIVNSSLVKLEKIPSVIDETFKIDSFTSIKHYILFVLIIMFLEDKSNEEQFILSDVTTFIMNTISFIEDKETSIDFRDFSTRKNLVDVLKYSIKLGIIKQIDGNDDLFKDNAEVEVLYENTGISHYIIRQFKNDIFNYNEPIDFLNTNDGEELLKKRYFVYRTLLFYPIFNYSDFELGIYNYFITYRNGIINDLDNLLDGNLLIFNNMALLTTEEKINRNTFPNSRKMIHDIILLVNNYLVNNNFNLIITKLELEQLLNNIHKEKSKFFSKEYREMKQEKFFNEVINAMKNFKILEEKENKYIISPIIYLINGNYLEEKKEETIYEQLSIGLEF